MNRKRALKLAISTIDERITQLHNASISQTCSLCRAFKVATEACNEEDRMCPAVNSEFTCMQYCEAVNGVIHRLKRQKERFEFELKKL